MSDYNPFDSQPDQPINQHPDHTPNGGADRKPNNYGGGNEGSGDRGSYSRDNGNHNQGGGYSNNNRPAYNRAGGDVGGYPRQGGGQNNGYRGGGGQNNGSRGGGGFQPRPKPTEEELAAYQLYKSYAVIAEKGAPDGIVTDLAAVIRQLDDYNYVCRCTPLSELEDNVNRMTKSVELILPFKGFNDLESKFTYTPEEAKELAKRCHPTYGALKPFPQTICATRVRQVLGKELRSPVQMLIIWTQDGAQSVRDCTPACGTTRVAIDLATQLHIPVFNLQRPDALQKLHAFVNVS